MDIKITNLKKMRNIVDIVLRLKFILSPFHPYGRQVEGVPVKRP
jgi:hypothetical protein